MVTVNEQITDSLVQTNTKVLSEAPAMAMGSLYTAMGAALSHGSYNATSAQQQAAITMQAATVQGVNSLTAMGSAVLGRAAEGIINPEG